MAAIFQAFSNASSLMKIDKFWSRFHWSFLPRTQLTIFKHSLRQWLGAGQATSRYLNQWWLVYWSIYASLGLNELKRSPYRTLNYMWCQLIADDFIIILQSTSLFTLNQVAPEQRFWWQKVAKYIRGQAVAQDCLPLTTEVTSSNAETEFTCQNPCMTTTGHPIRT